MKLEELAEKTGYKLNLLKSFVNYHPRALDFFSKEKIYHKGKYRPMWVIDDDKLEEFKEFWIRRQHNKAVRKAQNAKITRTRWTNYAKDCFDAKLDCSQCQNNFICASLEKYLGERKMKKFVITCYKTNGAPPERIFDYE